MTLAFGCIADDVTGGTDLALALTRGGARVCQMLSIEDQPEPPKGFDAVVISLKIRTIPASEAVSQALQAAALLKQWGAQQLFFKYCSTFDSTPRGNIGPIAEALSNQTNAETVPFVPSFPENGRTVYQGHLFVGDRLLSQSSMRDHPLTPMHEPDLQKVLAAQCADPDVSLVPLQDVEAGAAKVRARLKAGRFSIVDALKEDHLSIIAQAVKDLPLVTGGSALGESLARAVLTGRPATAQQPEKAKPVAILSGSCSAASQQQAALAAQSWPHIQLTKEMALAEDFDVEAFAREAYALASGGAVLLSSTAAAIDVASDQSAHGRSALGDAYERLHGKLAKALHNCGITTFLVAGGETSGAVAAALALKSMAVGAEIAPGVPWMFSGDIAIAFKSGNFGRPTFYADALEARR